MDEELLAAEHIDDAGSLSGFCLLDDGGSSDGSATGDCSDEDAVCLGARKVRASSEHETETAVARRPGAAVSCFMRVKRHLPVFQGSVRLTEEGGQDRPQAS